MTLYFNSSASGGDANQNLSDSNNFWEDSGDTIPHGTTPTSSDDLVLQESPTNGAANCNNLSDGGTNPIAGASITVYGTAASITINSGSLIGPGGTLSANSCIFNADPGGAINGNSCQYNANIAGAITDTGSTFGAYTFGGIINYTGTLTVSGATFTNTVTATGINGSGSTFQGAVHCNVVDGGTFDSTVYQTGAGVYLINATYAAVSWSGVTSCNAIDGRCAFDGKIFSVDGQSISADCPAVQYVLTGQTSNHTNGTLTLPTAAEVETGVTYGVGGNGSTGTLSPGGGTRGYAG